MEDNNKNDDDNNKETSMTRVSQLWDYIVTCGFCEDIKGIGLMMMVTRRRTMTRWRPTTRTAITTWMTPLTRVSQLWDKFGKKAVKSTIVELQKFFYTVFGVTQNF